MTTILQSIGAAGVSGIASIPPLWIGAISILLFALAAVACHVIAARQNQAQAEVIKGKHFLNEAVDLDGKHYYECTFQNVRFVFSGKHKIGISKCTFSGIVLVPTSPESNQALGLVAGLGMLPAGVRIFSEGPLNITPPTPQ